MCGIAGLIRIGSSGPAPSEVVAAMLETLEHRGPDGDGLYTSSRGGLCLGHRRLSVIDLSTNGAQPMKSACGRYVLSFNGEIYNFRRLLAELRGLGVTTPLRGSSDSEVLLLAIGHWGLHQALKRSLGMFALALYDSQQDELWLARDRMGQKPLYYGQVGTDFLFASELRAFTRAPGFQAEVDPLALTSYLRLGYVPSPYCIVKGVRKLEPAHLVKVNAKGEVSTPEAYWRPDLTAVAWNPDEALSRLEELLRDSIELRMIADVPLGVLLSGGVDSSLITALAQKSSPQPVRTFTIGFTDKRFNEATAARSVSQYLGTEHTEVTLSPEQALKIIARLPELHDEPFADPSALPTYLVSEVARRDVTVALGGDGGDELFLGYSHHQRHQLWAWLQGLPGPLRRALAGALSLWRAAPFRLDKARGLLESPDLLTHYQHLMGGWFRPHELYAGSSAVLEWERRMKAPTGLNASETLAYFDRQSYLPDNILCKVDRASMAISLEARAPLLDHRVVEFAGSLPLELKIRQGSGKWLLKQLLRRHLPDELVDRPKQGFCIPLASWLRGPLKAQAQDWLSPSSLSRSGFFDPEFVGRRWRQFESGQPWEWHLWILMAFEQWWAEFK